MKRVLLILSLHLVFFSLKAQYTFEGVVVDSTNQKKLPFVNVYHPKTTQGTVTNDSGYYRIKLDLVDKTDSVLFSYIGYRDIYVQLDSLIDKDTILMSAANTMLGMAYVLEDGMDAYSIFAYAFQNVPDNFSQKNRTVYAYYKENLYQSKQLIGDNQNNVIHGGRNIEAALKIQEGPYKDSRRAVEETNCIISIRKPKDTIFHSKIPKKFMRNNLFFLQRCNVAKYNAGKDYDKEKRLKKDMIMKIDQVINVNEIEHIFKISFRYRDTSRLHYNGFIWISSDNYKIYRYEIDVHKRVYEDNYFKAMDAYINIVPHKTIVSYVQSSDGLVLSYLKDYYIEEYRNKNKELIIYDIYDTELIYVSPEKFKDLKNDCTPIDKNIDIGKQKENSDPDFWKEFNVK